MAIKLLNRQPKICVRVNGKQLKSYHVGIGCWQEFVLSHFFFRNLHEMDCQAHPNR